MKAILRIALISIMFVSTSATRPSSIQPQSKVYICVGGSAYAYHQYESCSGLNRCTHKIIAVTVKDAKEKYGRKACRVCY